MAVVPASCVPQSQATPIPVSSHHKVRRLSRLVNGCGEIYVAYALAWSLHDPARRSTSNVDSFRLRRQVRDLRASFGGGPDDVVSCQRRRARRAHPFSRVAGAREYVVPEHGAPGGEPCPADVVTNETVLLCLGLPGY